MGQGILSLAETRALITRLVAALEDPTALAPLELNDLFDDANLWLQESRDADESEEKHEAKYESSSWMTEVHDSVVFERDLKVEYEVASGNTVVDGEIRNSMGQFVAKYTDELAEAYLDCVTKSNCEHEPEGHTFTYSGADSIIDVNCRKCGVSGSFYVSPDDINWEDS